jgi:hypothetical protein
MVTSDYILPIYPEETVRQEFDKAIAQGRLSADENARNFAGLYMFMGFDDETGEALFKNIDMRVYID